MHNPIHSRLPKIGLNPLVHNPGFYNPGLPNPGLYNPGLPNPGLYNPGLLNPGLPINQPNLGPIT